MDKIGGFLIFVAMRLMYFILKITLPYSLRVFYRQVRKVNSPNTLLGRTIYVSNHAASFMDPLIVAALRSPIVFFMTRSDVFTPLTKPLLWASHMLPIYREHDGEDTKKKNNEVFEKCARILSFGRNLLIFGEGFTDDVPIRRLKPVKKGAARIGFQTLEKINWKKKIHICAVGVNYTEPNLIRSDVLVSTGERICLNDYREVFEENPNKAISEVTKRIETMMQEQITHVEDKAMAPVHENIMRFTKRGMAPKDFKRSLSLKSRWKYSQKLAHWINEQDKENEKIQRFAKDSSGYFSLLKRFHLEERLITWKVENPSGGRMKELMMMILLFPFSILGLIHCGIPYFLIKNFVEKSFKRKVFWGSVKMLLGKIAMGLLNIPFIFLFYHFVYPSWWLAFLYYACIGLFGLAAYLWMRNFKDFKAKGIINDTDLSKIIAKRNAIKEELNDFLPKEFV